MPKHLLLLRLIPWLRAAMILLALAWGVLTTRIAVLGENPCGPMSGPMATVISHSVNSPFKYGVVSGLTLGQWPVQGYGQIDACVFSDVGVGIPLPAFERMRLSASYAWAAGRGLGFALACWFFLWAASWLLQAALSLWRSPASP